MLVSKNSTVCSIKLISGEEIICKNIASDNKSITISSPLMFVLSNEATPEGKNNVMFAPWMIGIDLFSSIDIDKSNIIAIANPSNPARIQYLEAIGEQIEEQPKISS